MTHRRRSGMTLVEIIVVIAILAVVAAIAIPSLGAFLELEQKSAANEIARTHAWLMDEAALRNVTFRVVYDLDRNTWKVEVGDPDTVVFATPEDREKHDKEVSDSMSRYTKREIEEGDVDESVTEEANRFQGLDDPAFESEQELPGGTRFLRVWTPQYGDEGMMPSEEPPEDASEDAIAYTYIFADGTAEHALVTIVDEDDPEDGYTVEVEPLSGRVHVHADVVDRDQTLAWLPDKGPELE